MGSAPISVLAVDDNAAVLVALESRLAREAGIRWTGSLTSADGLAEAVARLSPTVVLLDLDMPGRSAIDALADLTREQPATRVIILSGHVRRELVDRAVAATTPFTRDFQELITAYAWGEIWTRPGLDRRSRSMITLTALVALGHHEELAMHLRAARTNGLTDDEIKEVLLQSAIYCGVPAANAAFRIARQVLGEEPS